MLKYANADSEKGDGVWKRRRRSIQKRMQKLLFPESPDSDGDKIFQRKRDDAGEKKNKKVITAPPAPIFHKKMKKKNKNKASGKKCKKC